MDTLINFFKSSAKLQTAVGLGLGIIGTMTMFTPFFSSAMFTSLLAISVAGGGLASCLYAYKATTTGQKIWQFIAGLLALVAAVVIYLTPVLSMYSLTAIAICYLVLDGLFSVYSAFKQRDQKGNGWVVFSAICSLVLAYLLVADWPVSGLYAVGMFMGVKLITSGWTLAMLGFAQYEITEVVEDDVREDIHQTVNV